jgi:3-dehydroquinate synthase
MDPCLIPVKLPHGSYDIVIQSPEGPRGHNLIHLGSQMRARGLAGKALVVSHPGIAKHFAEKLMQGLQQAGFAAHLFLLPAGERYKTLRSVARIYDAALSFGLERSSTLIALGGGVIGDMVGFAAATWLRGIPWVQVPTSLLAMVDAAIGGKTGVNHPGGKNLIGAFYQPRLVWMDPTVLQTLPRREFTSALAEVIKYGVIQAADLFEFLEEQPRLGRYTDFAPSDLHYLLRRCAECKAWVVQQGRTRRGLAGHPQLRPYPWPCPRNRYRLPPLPTRGGCCHRHGSCRGDCPSLGLVECHRSRTAAAPDREGRAAQPLACRDPLGGCLAGHAGRQKS